MFNNCGKDNDDINDLFKDMDDLIGSVKDY